MIEYDGTAVEYLYRDAGNWKFWGKFSVTGNLSFEDIRPFLLDNLWFVPQAVGVPTLTPAIRNQDDHCLHEIYMLTPIQLSFSLMTAGDFLDSLKAANKKSWWQLLTW